MTDYYLVKPNIARILMPQTIIFVMLCALLVLGLIINLSLFDISVDMSLFLFVFLACFLLVVAFPDMLKYRIHNKISFYFYADRLMYNSFVVPYDKIINVYEKRELKPIAVMFDSLFATGNVIIEMYDDNLQQNRIVVLENVNNPKEMTNYIVSVITRYRNYKGTAL